MTASEHDATRTLRRIVDLSRRLAEPRLRYRSDAEVSGYRLDPLEQVGVYSRSRLNPYWWIGV